MFIDSQRPVPNLDESFSNSSRYSQIPKEHTKKPLHTRCVDKFLLQKAAAAETHSTLPLNATQTAKGNTIRTGSDVIPVSIVRGELLEGRSLHKIGPHGNLNLHNTTKQKHHPATRPCKTYQTPQSPNWGKQSLLQSIQRPPPPLKPIESSSAHTQNPNTRRKLAPSGPVRSGPSYHARLTSTSEGKLRTARYLAGALEMRGVIAHELVGRDILHGLRHGARMQQAGKEHARSSFQPVCSRILPSPNPSTAAIAIRLSIDGARSCNDNAGAPRRPCHAGGDDMAGDCTQLSIRCKWWMSCPCGFSHSATQVERRLLKLLSRDEGRSPVTRLISL